jgi:hypothetical protein
VSRQPSHSKKLNYALNLVQTSRNSSELSV